MRDSVTAARLKCRMRAICYFGPAPLKDRMSALRRVKRCRRRASRRPKKIGASPLRHFAGENLEKRAHCRFLRHRWAIERGNSHAAPPDCSDGAEFSRCYGQVVTYLVRYDPGMSQVCTWHLLASERAATPVSGASAVARGEMPFSSSGPVTGTPRVGAVISTGPHCAHPEGCPSSA